MSVLTNLDTNLKILNKPFLRWTGGKIWLTSHIQDLIKNFHFNNYHEPFLGGGSIFFSLKNYKKAYLSDFNSELINCYKQVKNNPKKVFSFLKEFPQNKEFYYEIRETSFDSKLKMAAKFIFLNKTSFNCIYRVNLEGKYNVPFGKKAFNIKNIKKFDFKYPP